MLVRVQSWAPFSKLNSNQFSIDQVNSQEANIISSKPKTIEIVAGPNGSGKTTFASVYLLGKQGRTVYLNPDRIAAGIAPLDLEKASFCAGRILVEEIKSMIVRGDSFAFESTLSGRTWLAVLKKAIDQGYQITIYFLYLESVKKNLQRIKKRIKLGGHAISSEAVHRRHPRCFNNFWRLYRPVCSDWYVFDNSGKKPRPLLSKIEFEKLSEKRQSQFLQTFLRGEIP